MSLTTLSRIKGCLNRAVDDTSEDAWLESLRVPAESIIKARLGRDIESASYTDYYAGNGTHQIVLRQRPVTAIASVYLDYNGWYGHGTNPFGSSALLTDGSDYVLDWDNGSGTQSRSGLLIRIGGVWAEVNRTYVPGRLTSELYPSAGNIKVTYTAGYVTVPDDLQYAVAYLVAFMKRTLPVGGLITEEKIGDYMYRIGNRYESRYPELSTVDQILSRYKEYACAL